MLQRIIRMVIGEMPSRSNASVARGLIARANAARDARQYRVAASLYEEALRFAPHRARVRIQCGHMLKEAGDLIGAEEQYELAAADLSNDADLALQIGHLHKLAGRPDKAKASYARALTLSPGWREAERELASVSGVADEVDGDDNEPSVASAEHPDWVVTELLPRGEDAPPAVDRNILRLFRLGGRRTRSRWGDLKVMRGIESIRGYRLAPGRLNEIRLLIDGVVVHREPLQAYPISDGSEPQTKYVFNIWYDFSAVLPGRHVIDLTFHDPSGRRIRRHRETVLVAPPEEDVHPNSDASVSIPPESASLDDAINALPSMVRTTERRLLPDPVRTILVQRVDQLGDLVCSVPAIRRLRELFPGARLIGLVTTANAPLAECLGLFDEIVAISFVESIAEGRRTLGIEAQDELRSKLARFEIDLAIDLSHAEGSRAVLLLTGARFLYGFTDRLSPWLDAGLEFNGHDPVNGIEIMPPSRKILLLIEGLAALKQDTARNLPNSDHASLLEYGLGEDEPYAVLHAGARLAYSRWPHFPALVGMLLDRTDLKLILFLDDAAELEKVAAVQAARPDRLRIISGQIPFADFDALLSQCALFVGNDSGPKHLAALRGVPVVSLHMARLNWSEWGQEMSGRIISRRVPCAGCGIALDGEDCGKQWACLHHIRPEEVFAVAQELLEDTGSR